MAPDDVRLPLITDEMYFVKVFTRQHPFFMLWLYSGGLCPPPKKMVFLVLIPGFNLYLMFLCG